MNSGKSDILDRLKTLGACTGLSLVPTSTKFVLLFPWGSFIGKKTHLKF